MADILNIGWYWLQTIWLFYFGIRNIWGLKMICQLIKSYLKHWMRKKEGFHFINVFDKIWFIFLSSHLSPWVGIDRLMFVSGMFLVLIFFNAVCLLDDFLSKYWQVRVILVCNECSRLSGPFMIGYFHFKIYIGPH